MSQPKGKVRVFACGGCGSNIGARLEPHRGILETAFAELDIVYIDTSDSNSKHIGVSPEFLYQFEGIDGSGGDRSENHEVIAKHIRPILHKFEPADFNIVIHSGGGGSGSVLGPLLLSEMLDSETPVVAIMIGSADTVNDTKNTRNTFKSYESISRQRKAPAIVAYQQNGLTVSRKQADDWTVSVVMSLCVLFSKENRELDSKDLFNFLNFDRITTFKAQLALLHVRELSEDIQDIGEVISAASLIVDGVSSFLDSRPQIQYVGYLPENASKKIVEATPVHFLIADGSIPEVIKGLQIVLDEQEKKEKARLSKASILDHKDEVTSSGLVL
jgi:hypothetical protein